MTTRAEYILQQVYEFEPVTASLVAAGAAANIAHQVWQAKRRTAEKVQQAGLGAEHQKAKKDLGALQKQKYLHLGIGTKATKQIQPQVHVQAPGSGEAPQTVNRPGLKQRIEAQKAKVKDIENKGLQHYQSTLGQNPAQQNAARQRELNTQHP